MYLDINSGYHNTTYLCTVLYI